MLNYLTIPISVILGFLAGLGVGGGSLLMLWLTIVAGYEYTTARIINLLFFLPSALTTTILRSKQGSIKLRKILPAIITGCLFAAIFSFIGKHIDTDTLKKVYGVLLLVTGIRELFYRPRKAR